MNNVGTAFWSAKLQAGKKDVIYLQILQTGQILCLVKFFVEKFPQATE
jgi:hypothetical protein